MKYLVQFNSYEYTNALNNIEMLKEIGMHNIDVNTDNDIILEKVFRYFFEEKVKENYGMWEEGWSKIKGLSREKLVIFESDIQLRGKRGWRKYFDMKEIKFISF